MYLLFFNISIYIQYFNLVSSYRISFL